MQERVLVVEDDDGIRELVAFHLKRAGFATRDVPTGAAALAQIEAWRPECLVLDLLLPDASGLDICRSVRERGLALGWPGVVLLTALADEADRVAGLEVGADDYVGKPFSPRELVARVRAVLRRRRGHAPATPHAASAARRVGDLSIDLEGLRVRVGTDRRVDALTATEFRLLAALAENPGRVLGREQLIDRVWGPGYFAGPRTVDVHVRHIREKLARAGSQAGIETVRGFGYRLVGGRRTESGAGDGAG